MAKGLPRALCQETQFPNRASAAAHFDAPAYDNGTRKNQFTVAGGVLYFF
jgi:hypothetical protein